MDLGFKAPGLKRAIIVNIRQYNNKIDVYYATKNDTDLSLC